MLRMRSWDSASRLGSVKCPAGLALSYMGLEKMWCPPQNKANQAVASRRYRNVAQLSSAQLKLKLSKKEHIEALAGKPTSERRAAVPDLLADDTLLPRSPHCCSSARQTNQQKGCHSTILQQAERRREGLDLNPTWCHFILAQQSAILHHESSSLSSF